MTTAAAVSSQEDSIARILDEDVFLVIIEMDAGYPVRHRLDLCPPQRVSQGLGDHGLFSTRSECWKTD